MQFLERLASPVLALRVWLRGIGRVLDLLLGPPFRVGVGEAEEADGLDDGCAEQFGEFFFPLYAAEALSYVGELFFPTYAAKTSSDGGPQVGAWTRGHGGGSAVRAVRWVEG